MRKSTFRYIIRQEDKAETPIATPNPAREDHENLPFGAESGNGTTQLEKKTPISLCASNESLGSFFN